MGLRALIVLVLIGTAVAAPWRCYRTSDGDTICYGDVGAPTINPPSILLNRPASPCVGPATVYTPCQSQPPCPCPEPCPAPSSTPCNPCNPCSRNPFDPRDPCESCLY